MRVTPEKRAGTINLWGFFMQGRWFSFDRIVYSARTARTVTADILYAMPFFVGETIGIDQLAINVTTAVALAKARIGIYSCHRDYIVPDQLLYESDELDCSTTGQKKYAFPSRKKLSGNRVYWLAFLSNAAIAVTGGSLPPVFLGVTNITSGTIRKIDYLYASQSYGSLPTSFPGLTGFGHADTNGQYAPLVYFRVAPDPHKVIAGAQTLSFTPSHAVVVRTGDIGLVAGGSGYTNAIEGMNFPTETRYTVAATLATGRENLASFNSSTRGYWAGGLSSGSVYQAEIDGIIFSTEQAVNPSAALSLARFGCGAVNSTTRGYVAGGYKGAGGNDVTAEMDGLQFSDESAINPSAALSMARYWFGQGVNSDAKGYWGGGRDAAFLNQNEIDGIQFSDETAINPSVTLITARYGHGAVNSTTRGYWGGGYSNQYEGEIDGIQFSDETQVNPAATLYESWRYCMGTFHSTTIGYFLGGYNNTSPTLKDCIDSFRFSDETSQNPAATLTVAKERLAGCQSGGIL